MTTVSAPTVLLGMSGGVDSCVAALALREQGYDVRGVTLQVWEPEDAQAVSKKWEERGCCKVGLAKFVAERLGIPHEVVDAQATFRRQVVDEFVAGYVGGTTPNPCVRCNERVKFGMLVRLARDRGVDFVATGHYARIAPVPPSYPPGTADDESPMPSDGWPPPPSGGNVGLFKGMDARKDQSYFLYRMAADWLPRVLFPVGHLQKAEVWRRAAELDLPADEMKESQEICFVTQGDYRKFLAVEAPDALRPGPVVDADNRVIGEHRGIALYTPGQRKGLGVSGGERLYVREVVPETNTVVLGRADELSRRSCVIHEVNWLAGVWPSPDCDVEIKYRYATPPVAGRVRRHGTDALSVEFAEAQHALSPGQSLVVYDGDRVLGGGIIGRFAPRTGATADTLPHAEQRETAPTLTAARRAG